MENIKLIREIVEKIDVKHYSDKYPSSNSLRVALQLKEEVMKEQSEENNLNNSRKLKRAFMGVGYSSKIDDEELKAKFLS
jgi:hypothetical protein